MMNWFGPTWGAPLNATCPPCETPVGESCLGCGAPIVYGHRGVTLPMLLADGSAGVGAYHLACLLEVIGLGIQPRPE